MAAISRLVAIGRRMKNSDRFTANSLAGTTLSCIAAALPRPASAAAAALAKLDAAAGLQSQLPFRHHSLAGIDALEDHQILIYPSADLHIARFHRAILLHNVDELPVLAVLNGLIGNRDGVGLHGQAQRDVKELSRPELAVLVLESALELDGAGGGVHGVVNEGQHALLGFAAAVLRAHNHGQLAGRRIALNIGQPRLENGE